MIGVYVRVSSVRQKTDSQEAELRRWLASNGHNSEEVEWYIDKESGCTLRRPEFERLQRDIFAGVVKTVVIWKLDRLSRSLSDGVATLATWCERNVRIISATQQIDLSGSVGRMVSALLFSVAEIEMEHRRERQSAGVAVAKRNGVYKGRRSGTTKAKPARAMELQRRGLTVSEIANSLGVSRRTVHRYLCVSQS